MFSFDLPKDAALVVSLPTGATTVFVHIGGGRFLSKIPPIALAGVRAGAGDFAEVEGPELGWDGVTLPGDAPTHPVAIRFAAAPAMDAVKAAGERGDTYALAVLAEIAAVTRILEAREGLAGMLSATAEAARAAVADGDAPADVVKH